jgi:hypothetical protein
LADALDAGSDCCNHEADCWVGFAKPAVATVGDYHLGLCLVGCHCWYIHRVHRLSSEMILMLLYFTLCWLCVCRVFYVRHGQAFTFLFTDVLYTGNIL